MHPVDRLQALIRHPDYLRLAKLPYSQMLKIGLRNHILEDILRPIKASHTEKMKGITFLRSWGLNRTVDPKDPDQIRVVLDALRAGNGSIFRGDLRIRDTSEQKSEIAQPPEQFFRIDVDLERPTSELQTIFTEMVNAERKKRRIKPKRTKRHSVDYWEVYDRMQVPGNDLQKITRSLYYVWKHPAYDEEANKAYSQVRRAYKKAQSLIQEVATSRSEPLTEEDATVAIVVETGVAMTDLLMQLFPPSTSQHIPFEISPRQLARMKTKWIAWLKSQRRKT